MLNNRILITAVVVVATAWGCEKADPKIETDMDKASYSIGHDIGSNLKEQGIDDINLEAMLLGMKNAQEGVEGPMTEEDMMLALETFQRLMMDRMDARSAEQSIANLAEGEAFLAENAQAEGVVTTETGLQYRVIQEGSGRKPSATDRVTVHYVGSLLDGTEFDSSVSRGEPATFGLNQVIAGWTEGVQLMSIGSKYEFYVPAALGYGDQGTPGGPIGPNAVLVFEVELLGIE